MYKSIIRLHIQEEGMNFHFSENTVAKNTNFPAT